MENVSESRLKSGCSRYWPPYNGELEGVLTARISEGEFVFFDLRSSAFIGGQPCLFFFR